MRTANRLDGACSRSVARPRPSNQLVAPMAALVHRVAGQPARVRAEAAAQASGGTASAMGGGGAGVSSGGAMVDSGAAGLGGGGGAKGAAQARAATVDPMARAGTAALAEPAERAPRKKPCLQAVAPAQHRRHPSRLRRSHQSVPHAMRLLARIDPPDRRRGLR